MFYNYASRQHASLPTYISVRVVQYSKNYCHPVCYSTKATLVYVLK